MTTTSDIDILPASGLYHIDALLNDGPQWYYMTTGNNTISYTFSISSGLETPSANASIKVSGALAMFNASQQAGARLALNYLSEITGIKFVETSDGDAADLHFANGNLTGGNYTGLASWKAPYTYNTRTNEIITYTPDAYVYLDNVEFASDNATLNPGESGYETLLHELGHALGLKHPFDDGATLPSSEDNTTYTLMSYTEHGGPYSQLRPYDIAALNFLYGGDGLGGALGYGAPGRGLLLTGSGRDDTLKGTSAADQLQGAGGNDVINGGAGTDTAIFSGAAAQYSFVAMHDGALSVSGADGTDWLESIELLQFSDRTLTHAQASESVKRVSGTDKNDLLTGSAANEAFDGGAGIDTIRLSGARADFTLSKLAGGFSVSSTATGTDTLINVERVHFNNASLALDVNGSGGQAYRLYRAAFDREPDLVGLGFWMDARDKGVSLQTIANDFIKSDEFVTKFGANVSNETFLTNLYKHVMHRTPDGDGYQFWLNGLNSGTSRAVVLMDFSESPENQAQVIAAIQNGFEYTLWQG